MDPTPHYPVNQYRRITKAGKIQMVREHWKPRPRPHQRR